MVAAVGVGGASRPVVVAIWFINPSGIGIAG